MLLHLPPLVFLACCCFPSVSHSPPALAYFGLERLDELGKDTEKGGTEATTSLLL